MSAPTTELSDLDRLRLNQALALAESAIGQTEPNPRVGCVIGAMDGRVFGRGATQAAGQAHAEVMALREATAAGADVIGACAWVTLEPCAHHGRTPPCCDTLITAGIARVVVAGLDPFPLVAGRGMARLKAAGIEVVLADVHADVAQAAREINIGFFSRIERGRPWVRLKVAASLDGQTALKNGQSQWITGAAARADGHAWRQRAGAVLSGVGTVMADDPLLVVRLVPSPKQPLRVIVDSQLRTSPSAKLFSVQSPLLFCCDETVASGTAATALQTEGAEVLGLPRDATGVDLHRLLQTLATRGVNELHVEAGARLNSSLLAQGLVDEVLVYLAPCMLGPGLPMANLPERQSLSEVVKMRFHQVSRVGDDLRLLARFNPTTPPS